jgi:ABC-type multidrug transport system fused ATPase/permease subunit
VNGFKHFFRLPLSFHTNTHINGELSRVSTAGWRISSTLQTIITVAPQFLSVIIGITLAASINVTLASILAFGVAVYIVLLVLLLRPIAEMDDRAYRAWNDGWNDAAAAIQQIGSVKQSAAEEHEIKKTKEALLGKAFGLWYGLEKIWSNISFYQRGIVFLTQLAVFLVSVHFVADGSITVGQLVALNGYALLFFGPFVALGSSWQTIQNGLTTAGQLEEIFEKPEEVYEPADAEISPARSGSVVFNEVTFRYGPELEPVLERISFMTEPGQVIALVGESGGGKSTTISLISGYYFPSEGSVEVDGLDTSKWNLTELRQRIAVVPQVVALFNDTIRANIRYGTFDASDEAVALAAKQAHMDEFIAELPEGYDTMVGERGIKLSVGQKQRIAIARAILRNPEILILDEPTSALDAETERYITASLEKLMAGRTTFIIAHRLSTVRRADKILVIKDGRIAEEGKHDELIKIEGGIYRHLHDLHIGLHE